MRIMEALAASLVVLSVIVFPQVVSDAQNSELLPS